jgi:hypothetical protein
MARGLDRLETGDIVAEMSYWRRPGKSHGISASTNFGGSDLFYPFTSSTVFEPEKSYSKFGAFAVLEHGGDFRKAAAALAALGYGQQEPHASPPSAPPPVTPCTLAAVDIKFAGWLGAEYDLEALHAVLAVAAAERLGGDPAWLLLVSGPGAAKTETV